MPIAQLKKIREHYRAWKQVRRMRRFVETYKPLTSKTDTPARLAVVPSDPWTLVGAKGDEAMILAFVAQLRERHPLLEVAIVTATDVARKAAESLGFQSIPAWSCSLEEGARQIEAFRPQFMVVIGADVMDGYYSPVTTAKMLSLAECAARQGARVSISGFSFNTNPNPLVRTPFDHLSHSVSINVRDQISLERFQRFSKAPAQLVSDAAFMLSPDSSSAAVRDVGQWASDRRAAGEIVLGFNMHPMLIREATAAQVRGLITSAVEALRLVAQRRNVALLLLSHDYRGADGDDVCLGPIASALSEELGARLTYPKGQFSAAELKGMAGATDGVVTGRMHLAIAALGTGRPVAALTYQDKFQGLFAHFNYPERFLLAPAGAADPQQLGSLINDFIDSLPALTAQVQEKLPAVKQASKLNALALFGQPRE